MGADASSLHSSRAVPKWAKWHAAMLDFFFRFDWDQICCQHRCMLAELQEFTSSKFTTLFHCHELRAKPADFDSSLIFWVPGPSCHLVFCAWSESTNILSANPVPRVKLLKSLLGKRPQQAFANITEEQHDPFGCVPQEQLMKVCAVTHHNTGKQMEHRQLIRDDHHAVLCPRVLGLSPNALLPCRSSGEEGERSWSDN